jgi:hypothetical protein
MNRVDFTNDSRNACGPDSTTARAAAKQGSRRTHAERRPETDSGAPELTGKRR